MTGSIVLLLVVFAVFINLKAKIEAALMEAMCVSMEPVPKIHKQLLINAKKQFSEAGTTD